jgi:hypothetical protein
MNRSWFAGDVVFETQNPRNNNTKAFLIRIILIIRGLKTQKKRAAEMNISTDSEKGKT